MKIKLIKGAEIAPYITEFAKLQIEIFKSYPYLQEMSLEDKLQDLENYCSCNESVMVTVFDQEQLVGASLALPLQFEHARWQKPFLEQNIDINDVFYFRESILLPDYRGKNIYQQFFILREQCARQNGCKISAFCSVERSESDHPVWHQFGYQKHPEMRAYEEWVDVGEQMASLHPLVFWMKNL